MAKTKKQRRNKDYEKRAPAYDKVWVKKQGLVQKIIQLEYRPIHW
jgi:hypothetical protein